jgi:hypothetical protein
LSHATNTLLFFLFFWSGYFEDGVLHFCPGKPGPQFSCFMHFS